MNPKQRVMPVLQAAERGWRSRSNYLISIALAALIVVVFGGFFLTMLQGVARPELKFLGAQELVSTTVFAIAGVMAMQNGLKIFTPRNAVLVFIGCFLTTNGGGTVRDLLLFRLPFWCTSLECLCIPVVVTALAFMVRPNGAPVVTTAVRIIDNFSTGVFIYVGVFKVLSVLSVEHSMFVLAATFTGVMTGMAGGMVRDFLVLRRVPTAFRTMAFINGLMCSLMLAMALKMDVASHLGLSSVIDWGWILAGAVSLIANEATNGRTFTV